MIQSFRAHLMKEILEGALGFVILLVVWHAITLSGMLPWVALPPISDVLLASYEVIMSGELIINILFSLIRMIAGWLMGIGLGVISGIIIGWFKILKSIFEPLLMSLRPIPPLAWVGLAIVWFGLGDPPALFIITLTSFWYNLINTLIGVRSTDKVLVEAALTLGVNQRQLLIKVVLPSAIPYILAGVRASLGACWAVMVAAEMVAVKAGLGYMIILYSGILRTDIVIVGMISIGIISLILDIIFRVVEQKLLVWLPEARR